MARLGYSTVTDTAFVAFKVDLDDGEWKSIPTLGPLDLGDDPAAVLAASPLLVACKGRLQLAVEGVRAALSQGPAVLTEADRRYDLAQRRFHFALAERESSDDNAVRTLAAELRTVVLRDGTTGHTTASYQAEVDFGRHQVAVAREPRIQEALTTLNLTAHLDAIATTTEALATAIGRNSQPGAPPSRGLALRQAMSGCVSAFNSVHEQLDWLVSAGVPGPDRDRLLRLRAPFEALLARFFGSNGGASAPSPAAPGTEAPPADPPSHL